jgi:hypothetical protein
MPLFPERNRAEEEIELRRKRKARNWVGLIILVGLSVLFFISTIAKMTRS